MKKNMYLLSAVLAFMIIGSTLTVSGNKEQSSKNNDIHPSSISSTTISQLPQAITVSDTDPFYALIATPLAVHYDETGSQRIIPLYVKNLSQPSKAVEQAEEHIGIYTDLILGDILSPKEASLFVAQTFWQQSDAVLIIEQSYHGYELGMPATPLASYLTIPIIVTHTIDAQVLEVLEYLQVETLYICGNLETDAYELISFTSLEQVLDALQTVISERFHQDIDYLTLANPLDITTPTVQDTTTLPLFTGTIASTAFLPTQSIHMMLKDSMGEHTFTIPQDYTYARIVIDLLNKNSEHVKELGDELVFLLKNPEGINYFYGGTMGGIPLRDAEGDILKDQLHFEITIYDKPGTYTIQVFGKWFGQKTGSYELRITIENLNTPIIPLMNDISSLAPYLTAYHKGIVVAKSDFAFAADDDVYYNGETCPGITQPGSNPSLIDPSNNHTLIVHEELNNVLADIAGIPIENLFSLREHYKDHPINIAIVADPTMIPMYFYYNPDGRPDNVGAYMMGFALPSDFIYGTIDPNYADIENDTYSYYPFQENIVGRVTGIDAQDCSALIARTFFYDTILQTMDTWKDNALTATGTGLEFQNLPILTRLSHILYGGRGEPTKFPTGESTFINLRLKEVMATGYTRAKSTFLQQSQREGLSKEDLDIIKKAGLLNRLLFPDRFIYWMDSDEKVTGGKDHMNTNLIFCFAHGSYNLFEHGDVLMDARGFPFITPLTRIYPPIRSGLNAKGAFDIRGVESMNYGPSVMYVVSCITARTDGLEPENTLSQSFLHAGVNAYIGATRVTADPGYLEPRPLPGGWGIGTLGLLKATFNLLIKNEYPDFHFGAVIAEDFMKELIDHDATTGMALRNAKNAYLPKDANSTFLWTPPLTFTTGVSFIDQQLYEDLSSSYPTDSGFERTKVLDKKYVAFHEFTLYGDPAFNPYQSVNP
jgi:hypothetical protein